MPASIHARIGRICIGMGLSLAVGSASGLLMPIALAASPQIIVPPGFNCPTKIADYPHESTHMQNNKNVYVVTTTGESVGCTEVVTSLTLTTYLVVGSLSSGQEVASATTTWYNTSAAGYKTTASVPCSSFGNGDYSAKVAGSFVYNGQVGQLPISEVNDIYVSGCP